MNFYKRKKDYSINSRDCYTRKCDVRLTSEEDMMLTKLASDNNVPRSDVMRRALKDYYRFITSEEEKDDNH